MPSILPRRREKSGKLQRPSKAKNRIDTCVYVIEAGPSVKVGISADPGERCRELQVGNLHTVRVYWAARFADRQDARQVELEVHRLLKKQGHHARGEWFFCSAIYARQEILATVEKLKFEYDEDRAFGWNGRDEHENLHEFRNWSAGNQKVSLDMLFAVQDRAK